MEDKIDISEPELKKLDKEVANFYKLTNLYFKGLSNLYGKRIYKSELARLLNSADKIKPESEFDSLILKNMHSNLRLNDLVIDFVSVLDFPNSVEQFCDELFGEGTWSYLEEKTKLQPWEMKWKYNVMYQARGFIRANPYTDEAKSAAKKWIPRIKKDILLYGKIKSYLTEDFNMSIFLLSPESGIGSSWNPSNNIFELSSYSFEFLKKEEKIIAVPTLAYLDAFHEVLGHAAHQIRSKNLARSLRLTGEISSISPTKSVIEGIAIHREEEGLSFLEKRLIEMELTQEDYELLKIRRELELQNQVERLYYTLIKEKELREKGFDGYKHLLRLTENPVIAESFKRDFKDTFIDVWGSIGHALGRRHYGLMEQKLKEKFGEDYLEKNERKVHEATLQGAWSWEIYPDAVCYFLREEN